jgi:hypothetical protein
MSRPRGAVAGRIKKPGNFGIRRSLQLRVLCLRFLQDRYVGDRRFPRVQPSGRNVMADGQASHRRTPSELKWNC